ncbi:hypothetical protein OGATHE_001629 [Ogataea polymorpha]|uniref:Uncharacterized protein n=1 Tax=Ogataea polymorpha TaxID=460523 RepID=A0A9P8TDZ2_9ASCO|nr:hypothetical protein OGATHE_001629 [Ogataea polymorpha]
MPAPMVAENMRTSMMRSLTTVQRAVQSILPLASRLVTHSRRNVEPNPLAGLEILKDDIFLLDRRLSFRDRDSGKNINTNTRSSACTSTDSAHQNSQVRLPLRFINNVDQIAVGQPYGDGQRAGQRAQKVHRQTPRWREPCLICLENQQFETPGHDVNEDVVHEQRLASIHVAQASYLDAHKNGADTTNQVLPPLDARAQLLACWRAAADHPARMLPVVVVARPVEREGELLALLDA